MKKLIVYTENYDYGGLEKFLFDFVLSYGKESIILLFNKGNPRIQAFAKEHGISFVPINIYRPTQIRTSRYAFLNSISYIATLLMLWRNRILNYYQLHDVFSRLHSSASNLLIINGGYPAADSCRIATIAARNARIKRVIMSVLSYPTSYPKTVMLIPIQKVSQIFTHLAISGPERMIDKRVSSSTDYFHVNSKVSRRGLLREMFFPREKVKVIYTGVQMPNIEEETPVRSINNDFLSILKEPGEIWLGMTGFVNQLKGQIYLLRALEYLKKRQCFEKLKVLIVGGGPELERLKAFTKTHGLAGRVIFTNKYPYPMSDIYRFLDIFIFTSLHEGLPYSISEAMAHQLPIISTNVGGIPEQISNGINGFLVNKADYLALAEKIDWLMENPQLWPEIGKKARDKAVSTFSFEAMMREFNKIL